MPHSLLEPWRDFFSLTGEASATLVGLMFVAASVGSEVFTEERQVGLRTFLSPTVVAFSVVLASCIVGVVPSPSPLAPAILLGGVGLFGVLYSSLNWRRMFVHGLTAKIDWQDRLWYALAPILAYLALGAAGAAFLLAADFAPATLASGVCLLLLAGVRNAWDMTTWIILRSPSSPDFTSVDRVEPERRAG